MKNLKISDEELLLMFGDAYKKSDIVVEGKSGLSLEAGDELCRITTFYKFLILRRMSKDFWKYTKENK